MKTFDEKINIANYNNLYIYIYIYSPNKDLLCCILCILMIDLASHSTSYYNTPHSCWDDHVHLMFFNIELST